MKKYDAQNAREIYRRLHSDNIGNVPITADIVNGILEGFVYGHHSEHPHGKGETLHLEVSGEILTLPSWGEGIRDGVQTIINSKIESRKAA